MATVYLGTSDFAVTVLERLAASGHRPALVVSRPDRPRGRGRKPGPPPVAAAARRLRLDLYQPESVNTDEARERIAATGADTLCLCAFGALVKEPLLSWRPILNVHPSLLPRWRGAAPIERAIDAGDERTGVAVIRLTAELDAGPICLERSQPIRPDDDFGSLSARLAALGGELLAEALETRPECRPQPDEGVTYAERIAPEERRLDPGRPALGLERRVRALTPHVGAYVELAHGERLGVRRALALQGVTPRSSASGLTRDDGRLLLPCADGALELLEVQPAGGRAMDAAAYLRGRGAGVARAA